MAGIFFVKGLPLTDRMRTPYPAGGLFATAQDLGEFCPMILNFL